MKCKHDNKAEFCLDCISGREGPFPWQKVVYNEDGTMTDLETGEVKQDDCPLEVVEKITPRKDGFYNVRGLD